MNTSRLVTLVTAYSFVLLTACGGGGGSSNPSTSPSTPSNTAPEAKSDSVIVTNGQSTNLDVLANDSDADGDALSITRITGLPTLGSAEIVEGQIQYTPTDTYSAGQDSLIY